MVVDWYQRRTTRHLSGGSPRARNRKARSHDRAWNHLAHRRILVEDLHFMDHRNLWSIGIILVVIGVVLALLGSTGRAVGGRRHYF